ncbi:MAG: hypothetical protein WC101_03110 [Candidatus Gracilibacteria bacterium]
MSLNTRNVIDTGSTPESKPTLRGAVSARAAALMIAVSSLVAGCAEPGHWEAAAASDTSKADGSQDGYGWTPEDTTNFPPLDTGSFVQPDNGVTPTPDTVAQGTDAVDATDSADSSDTVPTSIDGQTTPSNAIDPFNPAKAGCPEGAKGLVGNDCVIPAPPGGSPIPGKGQWKQPDVPAPVCQVECKVQHP